jgi:type I restriction enzyme, S subunit
VSTPQRVEGTNTLRRFKPYPTHKDSGVGWLGKIPEDWEVRRLKAVASVQLSNVDKKSVDGQVPVRLCNYTDVYYHERISSDLNFMAATATPEQVARFSLREADVLITKDSESWTDIAVPAVVAEDLPGVLCGYHLAQIRPRRGCHGPFLARAFQAIGPRDQFQVTANGITRFGLGSDAIGTGVFAIPPEPEQRAIAAFLDRETSRINTLVAKKERLIELLQEQRTTLITRAITKGLNPNAPMKDSGVEWLGGIPAHWEVNRTKFAARLRSGHTPSRQHPEYWQDCSIPWFGLSDVWQIRGGQVEYVSETEEKISELGLANSAARLLPEGTVILSRTASVGFSAILRVDMATTQDFVNWVCGPTLRPEYLLYVFRSMGHEFRRLTMGSTHQTIYMPDVGGFSTPVPPLPEQDQIVTAIRKETARIDALVARVREAIERLKELRTALISAAVTGKIDVRREVV